MSYDWSRVKDSPQASDESAWNQDLLPLVVAIGKVETVIDKNTPENEVYARAKPSVDSIYNHLRGRSGAVLLNFLHIDPPTKAEISFKDFFLTAFGADTLSSLIAVVILRELSCMPHMGHLWTLDDSIWGHVLLWLDYFLTYNHTDETYNLGTALLDAGCMGSLFFAVEVVYRLCCRHADAPVRSLLLSGEYPFPRMLVNMWLKWPMLMHGCTPDGGEAMAHGLRFMHHYFVRHDDLEVRAALVEEISRATRRVPGRVFGREGLSSHFSTLEMFCALSTENKSLMNESPRDRQIELAKALVGVPELHAEKCPREFMRVTLQSLQKATAESRSATTTALLGLLQRLCANSTDDGIVRTIIRNDGLTEMCNLRNTIMPDADTKPLLDFIGGTLVKRHALREFHRSYAVLKDMVPKPVLGPAELSLITLCAKRRAIAKAWRREWAELQTCCRRDVCPLIVRDAYTGADLIPVPTS
ncbi:hypothetical protein GGF50DRAFT_115181 [Schizophyllum commune]